MRTTKVPEAPTVQKDDLPASENTYMVAVDNHDDKVDLDPHIVEGRRFSQARANVEPEV